ncbi:MAG: AMP-binding protein [Prevotellaceae bacterium]|nr:AMP-binding protein [Prevotellaceae bacterium]
MSRRTIIDLFEEAANSFTHNTFLMEKVGAEWQNTTFEQTRETVYRWGAGLQALGVKKGDNIALLSEGRNAWIIGELAIFYAGAVNIPLSIKLEESNDLLFRLIHSDAKYIMVSAGQLAKIRKIKDQLPNINRFIILTDLLDYQEKEISIDEIATMGEKRLKHHKEEVLQVGQQIKNDDPATITYTSGTTADPKGVILTHRNYTANVEQSLTLMDIPPTHRTLIILPLDHCFAHVVGFYIFMTRGASVATVQTGKTPMETLKNIPINIQEIKPNLLLSVPALAKNFRKSIEQGVKSKGAFAAKLFNFGLKVSYIYNGNGWRKGRGWRFILWPLLPLFNILLFSKVRMAMGGKLEYMIGGGALLDKEMQDFYYAIGMPMYQGYGLSEATPVISSNTPHKHKFGSSGVIVKPLELIIKDADGNTLPQGAQGEIVIRGENVMAGYWKNESASKESLKDGWLYTGDLGYVDKDGLLVVLGRFKSLLIASDGEKYSPEGIEETLNASPYISQILLYNNQSPYTTALIVPNKENLKHKLSHEAWGSQECNKKAIDLIRSTIDEYRGHGRLAGTFPERWLPSTFALLPEAFTEQNGMVNSTMKIVRGKVEKYYAKRIEHLYTPEGKDIYNQLNMSALS